MFMSKDSIIRKYNEDGHEFVLTHYFDTKQCYDYLKKESEIYWSHKTNKNAEENYRFDDGSPWSMGQMLLNGGFELGMSVLTKDNEFLAAAGLRHHNQDETISLSRFFGTASLYPYGNAFILPLHIELSRTQGYRQTIITFNSYNEHLLKYYTEILPRKKDTISQLVNKEIEQFKSIGIQQINHVDQYVLLREF